MISIFMLFVLVFFWGLSTCNIDYIVITGIPLLCGIIGAVLQKIGNDIVDEVAEKDEEVRKIVNEIDRKRRR